MTDLVTTLIAACVGGAGLFFASGYLLRGLRRPAAPEGPTPEARIEEVRREAAGRIQACEQQLAARDLELGRAREQVRALDVAKETTAARLVALADDAKVAVQAAAHARAELARVKAESEAKDERLLIAAAEIAARTKEESSARANAKGVAAELARQRERASGLNAELVAVRGQRDHLEADLRRVREEASRASADRVELERAALQVPVLTAKVRAAEAATSELESQTQALRELHERLARETALELERQRAELAGNAQELARLRAETTDNDRERARAQAETAATAQELAGARAEAAGLAAELERHRAAAEAQESKAAVAAEREGALDALRRESREARMALTIAEARAAETDPLRAELDHLRGRVRDLEAEAVPVEQVEGLRRRERDLLVRAQLMSQRIQDLQHHALENVTLRQQCASLESAVARTDMLQARLHELEGRLLRGLSAAVEDELPAPSGEASELPALVPARGSSMDQLLDSLVARGLFQVAVVADAQGLPLAGSGDRLIQEPLAALAGLMEAMAERARELVPLGVIDVVQIIDETGRGLTARIFPWESETLTLATIGQRRSTPMSSDRTVEAVLSLLPGMIAPAPVPPEGSRS